MAEIKILLPDGISAEDQAELADGLALTLNSNGLRLGGTPLTVPVHSCLPVYNHQEEVRVIARTFQSGLKPNKRRAKELEEKIIIYLRRRFITARIHFSLIA
jgi:hypothetical protein